MIKQDLIRWCFISIFVLVMAACSGSNESNPPTVSGVAAAGSVLIGTVRLKDSSVPAKEFYMPIAADGSFQFDLAGLTAPFILRANGTASGHIFALYSFAPTAGVVNINPLSNLALTLAYGSDDLLSLYNSPDLATMLMIKNSLPGAIISVQTALRPTLAKFGAETVNFISAPYVANHQGVDLFLDNASISSQNGIVTLYDRTSSNIVQTPVSDFIAGSFDFIPSPVTTVGTVCISPTPFSMYANVSKTFTAYVIGSNNQSVNWSVVEDGGGSITNSGVYTAPAISGTYHVTATSSADSTKSASATIEVIGAAGTISITSSGPGEYTVMGSNFARVGGVEVTIIYDTNSLANPRISQGSLLSDTMFVTSPNYLQTSLRFAAMSLTAISGSGPLATISFDQVGTTPNTPLISSSKLAAIIGTPTGTGGGITVPVPEQPSASTGSSIPSASGFGSTSGTSTP